MNCYTWEEYEKLIYEEVAFEVKRSKIIAILMVHIAPDYPRGWIGCSAVANQIMKAIQ